MSEKHLDQNRLSILGIPPSRADAKITLPIVSASAVTSDLHKLGLTAEDLKPIDWRKKVPISAVENQANCGDCWAQSSTAALTDRFIIQKGIKNLALSSLLTTQCVPSTLNKGCGGGSPTYAGQYFENKGAVDDTECPSWDDFCKPKYGCGHDLSCNGVPCDVSVNKPGCKKSCTPQLPTCANIENACSDAKYRYKAKAGSTRSTAASTPEATIVRMKHELMNGPFVVSYMVPRDFMGPAIGYKWDKTNGIYINGEYNEELDKIASDSYKKTLQVTRPEEWADIIVEGYTTFGDKPVPAPAAHAVEVVGWDIGDAGPKYGKIPFWIIKNSWGPDWNEDGYFRIAMNDPSSKHPGLNKYLGLDVPVTEMYQISTGKKLAHLGNFGSGTAFDPDLSTGADKNFNYPEKQKSSKKKKNKILVWIGVGILFLIFIVVLYLILRKKKRKRK